MFQQMMMTLWRQDRRGLEIGVAAKYYCLVGGATGDGNAVNKVGCCGD